MSMGNAIILLREFLRAGMPPSVPWDGLGVAQVDAFLPILCEYGLEPISRRVIACVVNAVKSVKSTKFLCENFGLKLASFVDADGANALIIACEEDAEATSSDRSTSKDGNGEERLKQILQVLIDVGRVPPPVGAQRLQEIRAHSEKNYSKIGLKYLLKETDDHQKGESASGVQSTAPLPIPTGRKVFRGKRRPNPS
jgi:hypothetical protein